MQHPPPNRNQSQTGNYFQRVALASALGDETHLHSQAARRSRIKLDKNALISLAVIFVVVLISVLIIGIYNSNTAVKAVPNSDAVPNQKDTPGQGNNKQESATIEKENQEANQKTLRREEKESLTPKIIVYVSGAVVRPGVVEINTKSRINDAIQAAGGPAENADLARINLAQIVNDGEQIHVPNTSDSQAGILDGASAPLGVGGAEQNTSGTGGTSQAKINLNSATLEQLDSIPGIGPVTAREILAWREKNGGFKSIDDLLQISGIGEKTLEKMRPYLAI